MTTRDDARRVTGEPRADGLRLVPPRPDPRLSDPDRLAERDGVTSAGRDGEGAAPTRPAPLPERLYAARERKGVDLYRAERDTKIRARYLAALERGEYRELPGDVYTKGFLRNYALYLGLDAEEVVAQWRRERGDTAPSKTILTVPRPIAQPRPGLQFSPGIVVAALLTILIVSVGVWLGVQVMRYAKPPTLEITSPREATLELDETATSYTFEGTSVAGATISVEMAGGTRQTSADSTGAWSLTVDLRRGTNEYKFEAVDPETGKPALEPRMVVITVRVSEIEPLKLSVDQPVENATFENGAIPIQGTTVNATSVRITATWDGPAGGAPAPSPGPSGAPAGPPAPAPITVAVGPNGAWTTDASPLQLTTGNWTITITASNATTTATQTQSRHVSVAYKGVNLVVKIKGGAAWIKVWVDGKIADTVGRAGKTYRDGQILTFTGTTSVEVRTGSSGATLFTLNGQSLGALGKRGIPETWLFKPPAAPALTQRS
jgi:cytoskeletal protein RodZ